MLAFPLRDFHEQTLINCQDLNSTNEKQFKTEGGATEGMIRNKFTGEIMEYVKIYKQRSVMSPFHQYQCYNIVLHTEKSDSYLSLWKQFTRSATSNATNSFSQWLQGWQLLNQLNNIPQLSQRENWNVYSVSKTFLNHYLDESLVQKVFMLRWQRTGWNLWLRAL